MDSEEVRLMKSSTNSDTAAKLLINNSARTTIRNDSDNRIVSSD